jgi:hypothetical protein
MRNQQFLKKISSVLSKLSDRQRTGIWKLFSSNTPSLEHHDGKIHRSSGQCEMEACLVRVKKAGTSRIFFIRRGL